LLQADKSKLIPHVDYLEKELPYRSAYEEEVDFKAYHTQRSKRLEIERWVESLINATLDICKILLTIREGEIPETSREILFHVGSLIYDREEHGYVIRIKSSHGHLVHGENNSNSACWETFCEFFDK